MKKILGILLLVVLMTGVVKTVRADECDKHKNNDDVYFECLEQQKNELLKEVGAYSEANEKNADEMRALQTKVRNLQAQIGQAEKEMSQLEESLEKREESAAVQYEVLAVKTREFYKNLREKSLVSFLFSALDSGSINRELAYRFQTQDQDRQIILQISKEIIGIEKDKAGLEKKKSSLSSLSSVLDKQAKFLEGEVAGVSEYIGSLEGKIAALSAKQQSILAAKFASAPVPLLAYTSLGGCSSDIGKSPGFGGKRIGFFSFGVPNRTGMNQYGAKGRSEANQGYEEILRAYYNFDLVDYGTGFNITVNGTNGYGQVFNNEVMNIEDYLKHLYEMPTSWTANGSAALKAQAIAARSYALATTNNGQSSILPNEYGQVVKKELNDSNWQNAVNDTKGKVMVHNGSPISAWYSSTHGGFVLESGEIGWSSKPWTKHAVDAGSAGSIGDLKSTAYDRSSPWFYCDWGYRDKYNNTAWLKEEEAVDIVNAYLLWRKDNNTIIHLSQTDKGNSDTWSAEKVRQELGGGAISSINSIEVLWDGSGISKTIKVNGQDFSAQKFKNLFNIRAPANIQIKPSCRPDSSLNCSKMYGLYNVEVE